MSEFIVNNTCAIVTIVLLLVLAATYVWVLYQNAKICREFDEINALLQDQIDELNLMLPPGGHK